MTARAPLVLPPHQQRVIVVPEDTKRALREANAQHLRRIVNGPLIDFIPEAWHSIGMKPHNGQDHFLPPYHLAPLIDALERAFRGERVRFAFSVPPQHSKTSSLVAALARQIIANPRARVGYASYTINKAQKHSTEVRSIVHAFGMSTSGGGASRWSTPQHGGLKAGGIDVGFTGEPFAITCFPAGTMVETEAGPRCISSFTGLPLKDAPRVLAYDHATGRTVWRRVTAAMSRVVDGLVAVETRGGRSFTATRDHPVYVGGEVDEYREAGVLRPSDALVALRGLRDVREAEASNESRPDVQALLRREPRSAVRACVHVLWCALLSAALRVREGAAWWPNRDVLLAQVPLRAHGIVRSEVLRSVRYGAREHGEESGRVVRARVQAGSLPARVRSYVHSLLSAVSSSLAGVGYHMLSGLCSRVALAADGWTRELELQGQRELQRGVRGDEAADRGARREQVHRLQSGGVEGAMAPDDARDVSRAPHRPRFDCQRPGQPGAAVPRVPHAAPRIIGDAVSVVHELRGERVRVYDITVEGAHNFFANGVLVHNCVDDPFDGFRKANSAVERDKAEDFINGTLEARCRAIIMVMTRWHANDPIGNRLKDAAWEVVNLPAICDEVDPESGVDCIGRVVGDALWPEVKPADCPEFVEQMKKPYVWSALYMGRPRPRGDTLFGDPAFYSARPTELRRAIGIDLAYSEKTSADWNVAVEIGAETVLDEGGKPLVNPLTKRVVRRFYVLDVLRMQARATTFTDAFRTWLKGRRGVPVYTYPGAGGEKGALDHMRRQGVMIRDLPNANRDKFSRAQNAASAWNGEPPRVRVPEHAEWVDEFVSELMAFTGNSKGHDDQVDAFAAAHDALDTSVATAEAFGERHMARSADAFAGGRQREPQYGEERPVPGALNVSTAADFFGGGTLLR